MWMSNPFEFIWIPRNPVFPRENIRAFSERHLAQQRGRPRGQGDIYKLLRFGPASDLTSKNVQNLNMIFWGWVGAQFWRFKKVRSKYEMEYCQQTKPEACNPDTDMCFMKYWPQIHPFCNPETQSHACRAVNEVTANVYESKIHAEPGNLKSRMRWVSQHEGRELFVHESYSLQIRVIDFCSSSKVVQRIPTPLADLQVHAWVESPFYLKTLGSIITIWKDDPGKKKALFSRPVFACTLRWP